MPDASPPGGEDRPALSLVDRLERRHDELLAKIDALNDQVTEALRAASGSD